MVEPTQPMCKIRFVKLDHFAQVGVKIKKSWNHHPDHHFAVQNAPSWSPWHDHISVHASDSSPESNATNAAALKRTVDPTMVLLWASKQPLIERKCPLFDEVFRWSVSWNVFWTFKTWQRISTKRPRLVFSKKMGIFSMPWKKLGWKDENPLNQKQPTQSSPNPGVLLPWRQAAKWAYPHSPASFGDNFEAGCQNQYPREN